MPLVFPFNPDIASAATVPARLYNDPVYLELERERVFAHSWQLVGCAEQLTAVGDYITAEVGNDSIVIVRDADGLRGLHDEIQDEDIEICEIVQRNLRSRVYDRGRYSAKRENGVHHFHSLLHEFLT